MASRITALMGPCSVEHGNFNQPYGQDEAGAASMGPCSVEHGNCQCAPRPTRRQWGFNGAMLRRAWKCQGGTQGGFNGAMLRRAWKSNRRVVRREGEVVASMGPCSVEHGNCQCAPRPTRRQWGFNGAMLRRAGKLPDDVQWPDPPQSASMGPCSVEHGNVENMIGGHHQRLLLQWGHAP